MINYIIPARLGSKGIKFKNRMLLKNTLDVIPKEVFSNLWISTNDPDIIEYCKENNIKYLNRSEQNSRDESSIRSVMLETVYELSLKDDDIVDILYLTYPSRTWKDVQETQNIFFENNLKSLLCRIKPKTSPYLCFFQKGQNKGEQIINHNFYRRQDYPECFELSFLNCIFKVGELPNLNENMYNNNTYFYPIKKQFDIDTPLDLKAYMESING